MNIHQTALSLLARREHSQFELQRKLRERKYSAAEITAVLAELKQQGLQSDARYTESYIRMRTEKGYGPVRIAMELRECGISDELIAEYLDANDPAWNDRVQQVWRKKFRGIIAKDFKSRARQMNFLQYRGFTQEQIKKLFA